jgi:hypothetical protein
MKRVLTLVFGVLVSAVVLAACTTTVSSDRLQFALSASGTLGYEVDGGGVTIESRTMNFRNAAGAYGVTINEYRIAFFDHNGTPLDFDGSDQVGSVNLFVPAGILCPTPDEIRGCILGDEGWTFGPGPLATTAQSYQLLPAAIALAHVASGYPIGWYAEIEFSGFDTLNRAFTTDPYPLVITAPD